MNLLKWLYPGMGFKRWLLLFAVGVFAVSLGLALIFNYKFLDNLEEQIFRIVYIWKGTYDYTATVTVGAVFVLLGLGTMLLATRKTIRSLITVLLPEGNGRLVEMIYRKRKLAGGPAVTVIGGGHGLSVLLRGLKQATSNVTAVVTVADDGGSSGRLREELGIIPPGDMRNCLVALADTEPLMEKLFQYRFEGKTQLAGHSFGNLFLAAMNEVTGDMETALQESSKVLAVSGKVIPASNAHVRLDALMTDGTVVKGESHIPEVHKQIKRVGLYPKHPQAVASALQAIEESDLVILGPGSLYTSVMPNLLVDGIADALRASHAVKIYICNVMTQPGETDGYTASMHVRAIMDHAGSGVVDYVLVNSSKLPEEVLEKYRAQGAEPVKVDKKALNELGVGFVQADIMSSTDRGHHDAGKLAKNVMHMLYDLQTDDDDMSLFRRRQKKKKA